MRQAAQKGVDEAKEALSQVRGTEKDVGETEEVPFFPNGLRFGAPKGLRFGALKFVHPSSPEPFNISQTMAAYKAAKAASKDAAWALRDPPLKVLNLASFGFGILFTLKSPRTPS